MKIGKLALMTGAAVIAMAGMAAAKSGSAPAATSDTSAPLTLAQNADGTAPTNAELEARISALEEELQQAEVNQAAAANNPPVLPSGWWNNTSISGRMYYDFSYIDNSANGKRLTTSGSGNGTNFDIKRFYVGIDHTFNSIFSANVTTDATYDSTTGTSQVFLKKAYLQAKIDPLLTVRLGAADMPWIPFVEGVYGYRYLELTLIDRTKFGTSSDWGVHALGTAWDGILNYDFALVNGGGYKKIPIGGGVNRFDHPDFEGRINAVYKGFNVAVGGYVGKQGVAYGVPTDKDATRLNLLASYVGNGLRAGVEYFTASNFGPALVATTSPGDSAHGISGFASYNFLPEWAVFGRYDSVDTNTRTAPRKNNEYYNLGISWSPTKIVDFSIAYKHDAVYGGSFTDANGTIGATTGLMHGAYNEIGLFGDFQW